MVCGSRSGACDAREARERARRLARPWVPLVVGFCSEKWRIYNLYVLLLQHHLLTYGKRVNTVNTLFNTLLTRLTHRLSPGRTINLLTTLLTHRDVLTVLLTVWESRGVALRKGTVVAT